MKQLNQFNYKSPKKKDLFTSNYDPKIHKITK